ncbi:DNA adenine methylase [Thalassoglobus neptunius]|uniref:DNA adenine methylase n=1 Tax=Thalassoglobus neptunius TaxID=1938619 RepID=A0A5C5X4U1_9PLAN|nr:DNA adenine methylase [Thalassoglobus neptunius]TWT57215.1 DNA adenine methylase [Thalassoglobus neptunius]
MKTVLKWHGGKAYLAKKIIELLPPRDTWHLWREPYFGGGSVTFALDPEGISEAVNDVNAELFNFWKVLQDPITAMILQWGLENTPLSEKRFREALYSEHVQEAGIDTDGAINFFIRNRQSRQGLGRDFATPTTRVRRGMNENVSAWLSAIDGLPEFHKRLRRIEIRNMDALDFIKKYDHPKAVFYCDPPYLHETRTSTGEYREHEMTQGQHEELLNILSSIKGRFLLSGYPSAMYQCFADESDWRRVDFEIDNKASGGKTKPKKVECVWMNY